MGLRLPGTFRIVSTPKDVALGFPNSYTEVTLIAIDIERSFFWSFSENELDFHSKLAEKFQLNAIFILWEFLRGETKFFYKL